MWHEPPESPQAISASESQVHLWMGDLDVDEVALSTCHGRLTPREQDRVATWRSQSKRREFVAGRSFVRGVLARYLSCAPTDVVIDYGAVGKPHLDKEHGQALEFNVSHTRDVVLCALRRSHPVGVDVECVDRKVDLERLPQRYFAPAEAAQLAAVEPAQRARAFYNCWTRKEAFIKARGDGLHLPLDQFEVTLRPGDSPRLVKTQWDPAEAATWWLEALEVKPGYVAAVASTRPVCEVVCYRAR